jgi:molybdopterin converting factor small subunit
MQITVKLFATFRVDRFVAEKREYPPGTAIAHILTELNIQEAEIGMLLVNSRHAEPEQELKDGDSLSIFPLVGGG